MQSIVGGKKPLADPAFNYDNLEGSIWMPEPQGYDNAPTGQIEVREPSGTGALGEIQGGYYDNRQ
jgi:hypothetical protein